jgi:hypothetical protein
MINKFIFRRQFFFLTAIYIYISMSEGTTYEALIHDMILIRYRYGKILKIHI